MRQQDHKEEGREKEGKRNKGETHHEIFQALICKGVKKRFMSGLVLPNQSPQILVYWTRNLMEGGRLWTSQKMGHMENVDDL